MKLDTSVLIHGTTTPLIHPYFFVNFETQGVGRVIKWIIILLAAFVAVGFIFFNLDKIGKKVRKNKKQDDFSFARLYSGRVKMSIKPGRDTMLRPGFF